MAAGAGVRVVVLSRPRTSIDSASSPVPSSPPLWGASHVGSTLTGILTGLTQNRRSALRPGVSIAGLEAVGEDDQAGLVAAGGDVSRRREVVVVPGDHEFGRRAVDAQSAARSEIGGSSNFDLIGEGCCVGTELTGPDRAAVWVAVEPGDNKRVVWEDVEVGRLFGRLGEAVDGQTALRGQM